MCKIVQILDTNKQTIMVISLIYGSQMHNPYGQIDWEVLIRVRRLAPELS